MFVIIEQNKELKSMYWDKTKLDIVMIKVTTDHTDKTPSKYTNVKPELCTEDDFSTDFEKTFWA